MQNDKILTGGSVFKWNDRCLLTFPEDQILKGDIILSVNGIDVQTPTAGAYQIWRPTRQELSTVAC